MWKYFVYVFLQVNYVGGINMNLFFPDFGGTEKSEFNSIIECIVAIARKELYFNPTVAILEQQGEGTKENKFTNELITNLAENNIPQVNFEDISNKENHDINSITIVFFDTCEDIIQFDFKRIAKEMKFLMIISDPSNNDCSKNLEEIGDLVSKSDITFIIRDVIADKNKMFTLFPQIDENTCKEAVGNPTHINTCFDGTVQNRDIFPIKNPSNLHKCQFKVGMATLFPFSTIKDKDLRKNNDHIEEIKGSDFEIMKIITEYFNATLDLYYVIRKEENAYLNKDFVHFLVNGSLDACAGGLYRVYGDIVDYSGIYISQTVFWMYYAEREDRSWENLIRKIDDVYIFVIFYLGYSIVWYLISLFDGETVSLKTTLLYGWGALVGATSLQGARSFKQKLLNLMYLIMSIYLSAYISMQFYAFLTIRAPPQMLKTNDDVMNSGRIAYLKNPEKYFVTDEKYVKFANTSVDCFSFLDCAEKTLLHNGLTVMLQGNFYNFQAATAVNDEARILRATENLMTSYNEMLIRKNSSLVAKFQKVILRLFEAGITRKLYNEGIGLSVVAKTDIAISNMMASSYSCQAGCSITLMHFAGVFYVWIFGCVLSCFVFVIEMFKKR